MENQAADSGSSQDQSASLDVLAIVARRKAWLFLSCLIGLGIGAIYYFCSPYRYESTAELLLMQNDAPAATNSNNTERDVSEELLATHMRLIQSPRIVSNALRMTPSEVKELLLLDGSSITQSGEDEGEGTSNEPVDTANEVIQGVSPAEAINSGKDAAPANGEVEGKKDEVKANVDAKPNDAKPSDDKQKSNNDTTVAETASTAEPAKVEAKTTGNSEQIAGIDPSSAVTSDTVNDPAAAESDSLASDGDDLKIDETSTPLNQLASILQHLDDETNATDYIIENLYVTSGGSGRARNARVLNVAFRHTSKEDCELVTRALVHHYRDFVKNKFKDINSEAAELITRAKKDIEADIKRLEADYKEFRNKAPMLTRGASGTDIYTARYEELAAELSQLAIQRDDAAARLELVRSSLAEYEKSGAHNLQKLSLIDERNAERLGVLVSVERGKAETAAFQSTQPERMAGATAEYSQLLMLKAQLSQLTTDFGPEYPQAKAIKQQIAEMEGFLAKKSKSLSVESEVELTPDDVMRAYVSMLDHDLKALDQRGKDIEKQMEVAASEAKKLIDVQLEDESKIRARERQEQLYDAVIERLRDINLREQQSPLVLELIQEPTIGEKVEPKAIIAAAISMLCALLVGGVGVLVSELRDRSVHSPREFEEILESRVLAHLPNFQNDPEIRKISRQARKMKSSLSPSILTYFAPDSRASESFRALRTQVMFSAGGDHRILMTTSSSQGAGKSMLSSNMAVSMASLGSEVLLIDCDMRLPQVHRLFGIPNEKGLADAIENPSKVDDYLVPSTVAGLTLMTSGQSRYNPAELLSRPELKEVLETLRHRFSYIILDCPPVLAVSDPSILAPLADGALFVTVVDGESKPKTIRSKKILDGVGGKILGIVVNRSDETGQRYGYQAYGYESNEMQDAYYTARAPR